MAGKLKKSSLHGVTIRQLVDEIPEGCSTPDFEQKPVTLALQEGKNAIFRAVVSGEPRPEVHWQSSKGELSNCSKYQISSAPGSKEHVLQINKLTGDDMDQYRCWAVNVYGEATCSARLTVIEVGFRKNRKRQKEPQEDLRQQLAEFRKMLKKRARPPGPEKQAVDREQVWQLLMTADRKDYEKLCLKYGIMDFRGMLRRLQALRQEREDRMAQYLNSVSNWKHIRITKEGIATFELELDLKDSESKIYLYKDGEMVRYGLDSQSKRHLRRLGRHYQFQIQDLWPEDAGIYQVRVEDAEIFSTELEASAIPPRVVVPLAEARCDERGDAVFECALSSPCPSAAWSFQRRPLQPSDRHEVSVSPDGLTHRLVVRGARLSDMGPYSLSTGLYTTSAWLVVEDEDKGLLTTSADLQAQLQGAQTSAAGDFGSPSSEGGRLGGQGPAGGYPELAAGPDAGGLGGLGCSSMGDGGAADAAWGPGRARQGFLEDRAGATPPGENQLPGPLGFHPQGAGPGSGLGLMEGHQAGGRGSDGDRPGGTAGSPHPWAAGHGGSEEGQAQLWGAQLGPEAGKSALQGSRPGPMGSWSEAGAMEGVTQGERLAEAGAKDGLSREAGRGAAGAAWGPGAGWAGAADGSVTGGPGGRGPSSQASGAPEARGSQGGDKDGRGEARGCGVSGQPPGQTSAGRDPRGPPLAGGRTEGSWQEADGHSPGELVGEGRGHKASAGGPRGPQGLQGRQTGAALGGAGDGHGGPEGSQSWAAGPRGAGEAGSTGAQSTGPWDDRRSSLSQTGAPQGPGLLGSGQEVGDSSRRLPGSPGQGARGAGGASGGRDGPSGPGAVGSEPGLRNGTWGSSGGPAGEPGSEPGLGVLRGVGSSCADGLGLLRGMGPANGSGYADGSGAPGEMGSARGAGSSVASGARGGTESGEAAADRHGSQVPGNQDGRGPAGREPGGLAGLSNGPGGPGGRPMGEAGIHPGAGDASRGQGDAGPGGKHSSDSGFGSRGTAGTVGEGHMGAEPGGSGRIRPQGSTGDASGAMGAFGDGGPGAMEPGSLKAVGKASGGDGARGLGAGAPGAAAGAGRGADTRRPEAPALHPGAGSESQQPCGPGTGLGYGDGSGTLGPQHVGGAKAYGGGSGGLGPGGIGRGGEVGLRDGAGGLGGTGSGAEAGYRDGTGGAGEMRSANEAGYRKDLGGPEGVGSGSKAGDKYGLGRSGGAMSGAEAGHRGGLPKSGETGPESETGYGGGPGGVGGAGLLAGVGHGGRPKGRDATGHESGDATGHESGDATGHESGDATGHESGDATGHKSGDGAAPGGPYGGTSPQGGPERGRGTGLVNGADTGRDSGGRDSGAAAIVGAADGQGSEKGHGASATSGTPGALGATGSRGKAGAREWQDGPGAPSREGGSADQGGVQASGSPDGWGAVEGDTRAETAALESGHDGDSWKASPGTADKGGAAGQAGLASRGTEDLLPGGKGLAAARGSLADTGQALDSSQTPQERDSSASESAGGRGVSRVRAPGWEDQGLGQGSSGAGRPLARSKVSGSLKGEDATSSGTQERPESCGGQDREEAGGRQGPRPLDSKGSGPRRGRTAGPGDSSGAGSGQEGPLARRDSADRSGEPRGLGSPPGRRQRGEKDTLEDEGFPMDRARGPGAMKEQEVQAAGDTGRSGRRRGLLRGRSQTQSEAEAGATERGGADEARGSGQLPAEGDRGRPGAMLPEDRNRKPPGLPGSRRGGTGSRLDVCGQESTATQSARPRRKPDAGGPSEEARAPTGHFSQGLADTEVQLGEAAVLSCTLSRDLGPGAWFKDGVKLSAQDGLVIEQDGLVHRLLIENAQVTQAGKYSFAVGNQKTEATLTVQGVTDRLREPLVVKAGKPLTVKVPFQSHLPVQATWRKDGTPVGGGSRGGAQVALSDGVTRLCLPSTRRTDGGQYSVTLRSEGGSAQAELTVHVIDKPQPPQGPLEVQDCRGTGVCLRWRPPRDDGGHAVERYVVERRQASRSTWLKAGEVPADSTTFTDAQVEQGRKYAFRVRAVTSEGAGEALESAEVLVAPEELPGPPSAPTVLSASSRGITLTWTAPRGRGRVHILGYLVEKCKKGSNTWTAVTDQPVSERKWTVGDLRHDCQYEFRVTAVAPAGPGEPGPPSAAVFARDPMRPPGPVRDLHVTDTSQTSITVCWAPPDTEDGDEAQGYVVELCSSDSLEWTPCHLGAVPATTYTAKGLRPRESYFVRVAAVNNGGRGPSTALDMLVQAMPPSVSPKFLMDSSKDSLMVRVGDTIRVPVSFEAAPMPEVTWLKDGLPLPKRNVTSSKDSLTQLLVPAASLSDSGLYTVVLRGQQGEEATYSFHVKVADYPQAPGPISLQENVPGTVTAEWEPSPDEARGVPVHYTVLTRSSSHSAWREVADRVLTNRFTLLGVIPGHEYHFRVVAKNELGASLPSDTTQAWCVPRLRDKFTVKAPSYREPSLSQGPWFLVGLRPHVLPPGCECCMSCAVRGWPQPRVTWFKDGESLAGSSGVYSSDMLGVCSLVIASVSPEDSGQYTAVAENALGQAVSTATLIVTGPSS